MDFAGNGRRSDGVYLSVTDGEKGVFVLGNAGADRLRSLRLGRTARKQGTNQRCETGSQQQFRLVGFAGKDGATP